MAVIGCKAETTAGRPLASAAVGKDPRPAPTNSARRKICAVRSPPEREPGARRGGMRFALARGGPLFPSITQTI